jgi:hypothetical protein
MVSLKSWVSGIIESPVFFFVCTRPSIPAPPQCPVVGASSHRRLLNYEVAILAEGEKFACALRASALLASEAGCRRVKPFGETFVSVFISFPSVNCPTSVTRRPKTQCRVARSHLAVAET